MLTAGGVVAMGCEDVEMVADFSSVSTPTDPGDPTAELSEEAEMPMASGQDTGPSSQEGYIPECGSEAVAGPVVVASNQWDVYHLEHKTHIKGSLIVISGQEDVIYDLGPLSSLQCVDGDFRIEGNPLVPPGGLSRDRLLPNLKQVDGTLKITFNSLPTCDAVWLLDDVSYEDVCIDGNSFDDRCPEYYANQDAYQTGCFR